MPASHGDVEDRADSATTRCRPHDRESPGGDRLRPAEVVVTHALLGDGPTGDGVVVDETTEHVRQGDVAATGQVRCGETDTGRPGVNRESLRRQRPATGN